MKKLIYILVFFLAFSQAKATTYYWIGGTTAASFNGQTSWTTDPVGRAQVGASGSITIGLTDVFIFDGTNIGGLPAVTGAVSITVSSLNATPFAQLKFVNGANITLGRTTAGSSAITLSGDGTSAPDLVIDATSTVTLGSLLMNANVQILLDSAKATGLISGKLYLSPLSNLIHTRTYITSKFPGSLVFASGSECHITDSFTTSGFNGSLEGCVIFQSGASMYYYSGRCPYGSSATAQMTYFLPGSNLYFRGSNVSYVDGITAYGTSKWTSSKALANVFIQNGATITADGALVRMENLTIDAGCTYNCHTSGQTPIMGNITVNGTMTTNAASSNSIIMGGSANQTISGTGTINIPSFYVCDNSSVTLNKTIKDSLTTSILGKIDFGTNGVITGLSGFSSKVAGTPVNYVGNTTAGSYIVTGIVDTITGVNGFTIAGAGIPANTNTVAYSNAAAGHTITLSQPATATATGVTFSFSSKAATLVTANPNGFDSTNGCITVTGLKTFQSGTNYVINAPTIHPIGITSVPNSFMIVGNLTLNASVTTNYKTNIINTLTLNAGKMTIRPIDTVRIISGNDIIGAPFSAAKYIITDVNGANVGALRIDSFTNIKTFPVGTATDFLPVSFTPQSYAGFEISVFKGVTADATPTGTAFTASQKNTLVDAVWNISKVKGAGATAITFNWTSGLEGSVFSSLPNTQLGIASYNGTAWNTPVALTADNSTNIAMDTFSTFKSFAVGRTGNVLPVQLKNLSANVLHNTANVKWQIENESANIEYFVEKSTDGMHFYQLGHVYSLNNAASVNGYNYDDATLFNGNNFYRIKIVSTDGSIKYSNVLLVKNNSKLNVQVYPNPVKAGNPMTVSFNAAATSDISIRIIDMNGKVVSSKNTIVNQGQNVISVPTDNNIKTGNYIMSLLSSNNATESVTVPVIIK